MNSFSVPCEVKGMTPLMNKTVNIRFNTSELKDEEKMIIMQCLGSYGALTFNELARPKADASVN